jgi:hypothetical protein
MEWWHWLIVGVVAWAGVELLLALVLGLAGPIAWLATAIWHGFLKIEEPPGENDDNWSRDQGKEVK